MFDKLGFVFHIELLSIYIYISEKPLRRYVIDSIVAVNQYHDKLIWCFLFYFYLELPFIYPVWTRRVRIKVMPIKFINR